MGHGLSLGGWSWSTGLEGVDGHGLRNGMLGGGLVRQCFKEIGRRSFLSSPDGLNPARLRQGNFRVRAVRKLIRHRHVHHPCDTRLQICGFGKVLPEP